jgi:predicted transcriptional regulator
MRPSSLCCWDRIECKFFMNFLMDILEQLSGFLPEQGTRLLLLTFVVLPPMRLRARSTIDALILTAALNNKFGITKARLAHELVLTYSRVNKHCDELVQKRLLRYNPVTRTYQATPLGKEMVKLTEQLAVHYTPVNNILAKYKSRLEDGRIKTVDRARRILKETYDDSKSSVSLFAASPLLLLEHAIIHVDDCLLQAIAC